MRRKWTGRHWHRDGRGWYRNGTHGVGMGMMFFFLSARSKYFLRQKWMALKRSVPRYEFKTFQGNK